MTDTSLNYLAVAEASGGDAHDFLQAQLSADLTALRRDHAGLACYCSAKGRVIAVTLVVRKSEGYLLIMARSLIDEVLQTLRRYVLRAAVNLEETKLAVIGRPEAKGESGEFTVHCGEGSLTYFLSKTKPKTTRSPRVFSNQWHALELETGLVWLGPETSERYLPQMLGLDRTGAVSFRKGCFPGQEVIARARYLGQVKRLPLIAMVTGDIDLAPDQGVELIGGQSQTVAASVVDYARRDNRETVVFLVSSAGPEFELAEIIQGESRLPARRLDQA